MISKADLARRGSTHADVVEQEFALLRSKLRPPVIPGTTRQTEVRRTARSSDIVPLTLVVAPAGSGKTQLLANWVSTTRVPTAWLSLEEMDDDPVELWTGVIAALEQLAPECGRVADRDLLGGADRSTMSSAPCSTASRRIRPPRPCWSSTMFTTSSSTASDDSRRVRATRSSLAARRPRRARRPRTFRSTGSGCAAN